MILRLSIAATLLLGTDFPGVVSAQVASHASTTELVAQIEDYLATHHELEQFSGAALVADRGAVVYQGAFGLANADWGLANTVDTKFQLASVSKQFTAMLILLLVQDGQLELNAPIVRYLPDYPAGSGAKVTVHHLLNHTSGIPNYTNLPGFMQRAALLFHSTDEFVAKFCSDPLEFQPGLHYHYSNSGYYLLAAIIESVTGQSYGEALRDWVLDPLEMHNTGHDDRNVVLDKRATGCHELLGQRRVARRLEMANCTGAGSLYSTVGDLWKWDRALRSRQLLDGWLADEMFTPGQGDYGYGWFVDRSTADEPVHWHGGNVSGFSTMIRRFPKHDRCIVLLSNSSGSSTQAIADGITAILAGEAAQVPSARPERALAMRILSEGIEAGLEELAGWPLSSRTERVERGLNALGYQLLGQGREREALQLLAFNTRAFPESSNGWDSLGEAHAQAGDRELAIANYRQALELDPTNATVQAKITKLERAGRIASSPQTSDLLDGWVSEVFALPPGFAPGLPTGFESLRFAPRWRDASSEEYWSYAFVMWIDEPISDAPAVAELLDGYYDGLMLTFAGSAGRDIGEDPAQVEVTSTAPGHFEAKLNVIDAFGTFEPKELRVRVSTWVGSDHHSVVSIRVSSQAEQHPIWNSLEAAGREIREREERRR